jgi:hypothetical protein
MAAHYRRPGWFTRHVANKLVAGLTRAGISVWGSRVLEVRGRKSGLPRRVPVNLLDFEGGQFLVAPAVRPSGSATFVPTAVGWSWFSGGDARTCSAASCQTRTRLRSCGLT